MLAGSDAALLKARRICAGVRTRESATEAEAEGAAGGKSEETRLRSALGATNLQQSDCSAWLITFIAGTYIPFIDALGNWGILIGMSGMAAAFALSPSGVSTELNT